MISTIIFDLDGLLSDTETLHMKAYQSVLKKYGISLGEIEYQNHWIRDGLGIKDYVHINNLQFSADKLREEKAIIYQHLLDCELNEMPGAKILLEKLGMVQKTQEVSLTLSGFCTQTQKSQWVNDVGTTG